jgi:hypothetical protein
MRHHSRADDVKIESDECGFELHVDTEDGDTFVFHIHHLAWDLAGQAERTICEWRREGEAIRTEVLRSKQSEIPDDDCGYDISDPKHPRWLEVHADAYDNREKT